MAIGGYAVDSGLPWRLGIDRAGPAAAGNVVGEGDLAGKTVAEVRAIGEARVVEEQAAGTGIIPRRLGNIRQHGLRADARAGPVVADGSVDSILKVGAADRNIVGSGGKAVERDAVGRDDGVGKIVATCRA